MIDIFSILSEKNFSKKNNASENDSEHNCELKHLAKFGNPYDIKAKLHF
jgi:hypothetical protein